MYTEELINARGPEKGSRSLLRLRAVRNELESRRRSMGDEDSRLESHGYVALLACTVPAGRYGTFATAEDYLVA